MPDLVLGLDSAVHTGGLSVVTAGVDRTTSIRLVVPGTPAAPGAAWSWTAADDAPSLKVRADVSGLRLALDGLPGRPPSSGGTGRCCLLGEVAQWLDLGLRSSTARICCALTGGLRPSDAVGVVAAGGPLASWRDAVGDLLFAASCSAEMAPPNSPPQLADAVSSPAGADPIPYVLFHHWLGESHLSALARRLRHKLGMCYAPSSRLVPHGPATRIEVVIPGAQHTRAQRLDALDSVLAEGPADDDHWHLCRRRCLALIPQRLAGTSRDRATALLDWRLLTGNRDTPLAELVGHIREVLRYALPDGDRITLWKSIAWISGHD
ncbi:hypothetical protein ACQP2P_15665 [Dactylosporangium sp. CA-139114]|uniref:hypothetical protein n=1 Tax=Dactylosporangium sp. CA-139114 TaxID=3239931 RepID=UPI003D98FB06